MNFYDLLMAKGKEEGIEKNVVGGIILNANHEILILTRKMDDFMGGIDELPSGNLEKGEKICDGLIREIKEETNIDIDEIDRFINTFDYLSSSGKKVRQYNFSLIVKNTDHIKLTEHDEYKWQTLEEIRNNRKITKEVKAVIEIFFFNYVK